MALVTKKVGLFVGVTAALLAGVSTQVFSLGVDTLDGKHIQYNVTDDMLLEADKDPNNWLMYGRDYEARATRHCGRSTGRISRTSFLSGTCRSA